MICRPGSRSQLVSGLASFLFLWTPYCLAQAKPKMRACIRSDAWEFSHCFPALVAPCHVLQREESRFLPSSWQTSLQRNECHGVYGLSPVHSRVLSGGTLLQEWKPCKSHAPVRLTPILWEPSATPWRVTRTNWPVSRAQHIDAFQGRQLVLTKERRGWKKQRKEKTAEMLLFVCALVSASSSSNPVWEPYKFSCSHCSILPLLRRVFFTHIKPATWL